MRLSTIATMAVLTLAVSTPALAQGGCGSACIPLEVIDPEQADVGGGTVRFSVATEFAKFHDFKVEDRTVPNPAMAEADLGSMTFIVDYGVSDRWTVSGFVPIVRKVQRNRMLGRRVAEGLGDVAVFGRYRFTKPESSTSVVGSLGIKFPTGSVEEPGGGQPRLPQPFQAGSGAFDAVPAVNFFHKFTTFSMFGGVFARIPLEENKFDYEFGNEYEVHVGTLAPVSSRIDLMGSLDFLHAEEDTDPMNTAPPPFHVGNTVINTGGTFLNITPGLRIVAGKRRRTVVQLRFSIPLHEDWNGDASVTAGPLMQPAGQVAPDLTIQLTVLQTFR